MSVDVLARPNHNDMVIDVARASCSVSTESFRYFGKLLFQQYHGPCNTRRLQQSV